MVVWGEDLAGESAEVVEAGLDTEQASCGVTEGEGYDSESELAEDLEEGAVEAGPAEFEAGPDDEDTEEEFDGSLGIGGGFFAGEDTVEATDENCGDVEEGTWHEGDKTGGLGGMQWFG
ncbi:MAG: hypothetical protein RI897_3807 [Verrucomicrobiota bacterium]